jgi:ribosomal protein S18 acetylase RimI-like enzyme
MNIRAFASTDTAAVVVLWQSCGLVVPQNDPLADIERKLLVNPELFLVGEYAGRVVASVMGGYEGHRGWINYLAVDPVEQGKGYGRLMMAEVEDRLRAAGCPKINLQVRASNEAVIQFYESLGYGNDNVVGLGKRMAED